MMPSAASLAHERVGVFPPPSPPNETATGGRRWVELMSGLMTVDSRPNRVARRVFANFDGRKEGHKSLTTCWEKPRLQRRAQLSHGCSASHNSQLCFHGQSFPS
ncbi:hypothetical protein MRX96_035236 [Rhipicephalus microplus]